MSVKRKMADFLCAFVTFAIVMLSIAALTGQSFFEGAVQWDGEEASLSLFGTEISFDKRFPDVLGRIISFNGIVFGNGILQTINSAAEFFAEYISDGISFAYHIARMAVGAE